MKTNLDRTITTRQTAESYLKELYDNGESYHPEDNAHDISWQFVTPPTDKECKILNQLMNEVYLIAQFDPCRYLLDLDQPPSTTTLRQKVEELQAQLKTSITWSVADFAQQANEEENPKKYDPAKFQSALELMISKHDCNNGITWSTVVWYLDNYCV